MVNNFLNYLTKEKRYSLHTLVSYENDLNQFIDFLETRFQKKIELASHNEIRFWILDLRSNKISASSVNRKISCLRSFYKFLLKEEKIELNPCVKIKNLKTPKRLPVTIQKKDLITLLDHFKEDKSFEGFRNYIMLELFYGSGVRLSELIDLKITQVSLYTNQIKVTGKGSKQRIIPITQKLKEELGIYLKKREEFVRNFERIDYLFLTDKGLKCYPVFIYRVVNTYLKLIRGVDKRSPHVLRHSFATHMLDNGAELNAIKELLGHANLSATQVYTHNSLEKLKKVFEQAHPKA